jgi:16S rRNA (uracil1498-N3)-methyltransferase
MPRLFSVEVIRENAVFELDARAAQHVRALRLREHESVTLFDGAGGEVPAHIERIEKKSIVVASLQRISIEREASIKITLLPALIANDRFDWLIQKTTELGVDAIQPIYSERSQRIPGSIDKRVEHWRSVAIAACEQCGRNRIPTIHAPIDLNVAMTRVEARAAVLLDVDGTHSIELSSIPRESPLSVFAGPEGGFSPEELKALRNRCGQNVRVALTVLRAETAAIAALAVLSSAGLAA